MMKTEDLLTPATGDTEGLRETLDAFRRLWLTALPWRRPRILKAALSEILRQYRQVIGEWTAFFKALDDRFKKAYRDKATTAVEGMVGTKVGKEVLGLEKEYKSLTQDAASDPVGRIAKAFEITRQQVAVLALAYEEAEADRAAVSIQSEQFQEFTRLMGQPRDFAMFLKEHFPNTFIEQAARGMPHTRIAEKIMLNLKEGRPVN